MTAENQVPESEVEEIKNDQIDENALGEKKARKINLSSLKSRTLLLIIAFIASLFLLLIAIPGFFDNSALKFRIAQKTSEFLNANLTINGEVKVALFPYPAIIAEDVLLQNYKKDGQVYNLYSKSVKIKLRTLKFVQKEFVIRAITFSDAALEIYYEANSENSRQNKFTEITEKFTKDSPEVSERKLGANTSSELFLVESFEPSHFSHSNFPTIEIENGLITSYDKMSRKREITDISGKALVDEEKIRASGKFTNEKISNDFKLTANFKSEASKYNSSLELNSSAMNLTIKGSFTSDNHGIFNSDFSGNVEAEIFEIRSFYKDYISNNSAIYNKFKPNTQSIKISGEVKNKGGEISIEQILINSNLVNGKGSALVDFTSELPRIDVSLDLENLDLDNIWSNDRVETNLTSHDESLTVDNDKTTEGLSKQNSAPTNSNEINASADATAVDTKPNNTTTDASVKQDLSAPSLTNEESEILNLEIANKIKNFDLSSEIKIKTVKYLEGEIKNLDLYATISADGQILILPMIFNIPGNAMVRVNGTLVSNSELPKFIGKIDVSGKNLGDSLKWLHLQSQNLKFDNLKDYSLYSDVMLVPNNITLSNFYLNLNSGQSEFLGEIKIDSSTKITNISNKFRISSFNVDDFFLTSGQNFYLSSGSLLNKLLWLNDIASVNNVELNFDKLIYKGEEFSDPASLKFNFGQGYFKITDLLLNSGKTNSQASLSLDISEQNPGFELNVVADNLHYEASQIKKSNDPKDAQNLKEINVADQFFALPSLEGFGGNIAITVNNLKLDNLTISNAKLSGKLRDGNIPESFITCNIYGGNLEYKGLLGIKVDKIFNGNLTLSSIALEKLLPDLVGIKNISGTANISANITSVTDSKEDFIKQTDSEIKFSTVPTIAGYGLTNLVNKMFYSANFRQELQNPEKILFNPSVSTTFKKASGTIVINKSKEGKFSINLTNPAANGILSGKIDLATNSIDGLTNIIFVTGSRQKQIPLNIATALKGNMNDISYVNNLDQVRQYLGLATLRPASVATKSQAITTEAPASSDSKAPVATATSNALQNQTAAAIKAEEDQSKNQALDKLRAITTNPDLAPRTTLAP